jgi:cell division septum initiation protein DivIVA
MENIDREKIDFYLNRIKNNPKIPNKNKNEVDSFLDFITARYVKSKTIASIHY